MTCFGAPGVHRRAIEGAKSGCQVAAPQANGGSGDSAPLCSSACSAWQQVPRSASLTSSEPPPGHPLPRRASFAPPPPFPLPPPPPSPSPPTAPHQIAQGPRHTACVLSQCACAHRAPTQPLLSPASTTATYWLQTPGWADRGGKGCVRGVHEDKYIALKVESC